MLLMFRSLWRFGVVLALIPLVIFGNATSSAAATSGVLNFSLGPEGLERFSTDCRLPWTTNSGGVIVGSSARCDGGPDLSPGSGQPFEGEHGSYGLVLKNAAGMTCGSTGFEPFDVAGNDFSSTAAGLGGGYVPVNRDQCEVVEACLSHYYNPGLGGTTDVVSCVPLTLDSPGPISGSCAKGTANPVEVQNHNLVKKDTREDEYAQFAYNISWNGGGTTSGTYNGGGAWISYLVYPSPASQGLKVDSNTSQYAGPPPALIHGLHWKSVPAVTGAPYVNVKAQDSTNAFFANWPTQVQYPKPSPIGGGTFWIADPVGDFTWRAVAGGPSDVKRRVGITDSSLCSWYWGQKVATDLPGYSGSSDPAGDFNVPVTEDPVPVIDPPTEVDPGEDYNWLAAIWAVLKAILSTLANLASAIANAIISALGALVDLIMEGLEAAFVPSEGFLDQRVDDLSDAFEGTTLGNYTEAFRDLAPATAGGCEGPSVTMSTKAPPSNPLSACGGPAATLASASRLVITIGVGISAGLACVRILGRGLGWDPTPSGGAS